MRGEKACFQLAIGCAVLALGATTATATTIQDLIRVKGHEDNVLTGLGIVIGLDGTGDTHGDSLIAARPYAELLRNYGNAAITLDELSEADAFAIVQVSMEIPPTGVREGDHLDVRVGTLFNATSLKGGLLVVSPLRLPLPDSPELLPLAVAQGPVVIEGDNPRTGVVRGGGQMLADIRTNPVTAAGTMGLVLKDQYAGYPVATTIAGAINDEFAIDGHGRIAVVEDAKNIKVLVPAFDRADPAAFIATLLTIAIDPSLIQTEARIVINEEQGIILVTGNVEIAPVGITHRGLSISSITPGPAGAGVQAAAATPGAGAGWPRRWTGLDTLNRPSRSATRLLDLLAALDQLMVPVADQIAIIYELEKTGALHAEIVDK
jgi:flagellar P-ring protein precursor FlgI